MQWRVHPVDLVKSFHFSVSLYMSLFLNLLFEQDSYSNAYLLAKFGFDTAENEPCQVCPIPRNVAARLPRRRRASGAGEMEHPALARPVFPLFRPVRPQLRKQAVA